MVVETTTVWQFLEICRTVFNSAFGGKHPDRNPDGQDWPAGPLAQWAGRDFLGGEYFLVLDSIQGYL